MINRTQAPDANKISAPELPEWDYRLIGNKIPLYILSLDSQPFVMLELVFPAGRFNEPIPGIGYYLFKMLQEGTRNKGAEVIATTIDFYGGHLEISPQLDDVSVKLYSLRRFFPELLGLLIELLSSATFPEKEFQTLRSIRIQQIRQQYSRNNTYASLKFRELLFGEKHPYGIMLDEAKISKIDYPQVLANKDFTHLRPTIFITGQVGEAELELVTRAFLEMDFEQPLLIGHASSDPSESTRIIREDSTQASLRIGSLCIDRKHESIHKLRITNELLGGFFGSRLMKNIREEKGLTYGIHSSLTHLKQASYWVIGSELSREKIDLGKREILLEIGKMQNEVPGIEELNMVVNHLKGKLLSSFDSPFHMHSILKNLILEDLPASYYQDLFQTLDEIGPEDVQLMAQTHFDLQNLTSLEVL